MLSLEDKLELTRREAEMLLLVAEGCYTKEAAGKMGVSYKTADAHRSRVRIKLKFLGLQGPIGFRIYAERQGWIQ